MSSLTDILALCVPLAPFALGAFAIWTRHQQKLAAATHERSQGLAQYQAYNRDLEERIRVLERIVTDRGYDLAAQIEALRDGGPEQAEKRAGGSF